MQDKSRRHDPSPRGIDSVRVGSHLFKIGLGHLDPCASTSSHLSLQLPERGHHLSDVSLAQLLRVGLHLVYSPVYLSQLAILASL